MKKIEMTDEIEVEMKKSPKQRVLLTVERPKGNLARIIDVNTYSSCEKLYRVTAYVLRFVNNAKSKRERSDKSSRNLEAKEVERAQTLWIKEVQSGLPAS